MLNKKFTSKVFIVILGLVVLIQATPSYAWSGRHHGDYGYHRSHQHGHYDHPHFGFRVSFLPDNFFTIKVGGSKYYYCDGIYYSRINRDYVIINPPRGAVVKTIPPYYQTVIINGVPYYTSDGIYYVYTPYGYQVVPQPATIIVAANPTPTVTTTQAAPAQVATTDTPQNTDDSFTVNILNSKGGYTAVTIKRSGDGFVGPQGEFYSEFPKVEQLKAMYGKE